MFDNSLPTGDPTMKEYILPLLLFLSISLSGCTDQTTKGQAGAGIGAAGGALIGQAIGRDTEATLIGAAVGTMLGYIVGNEMDKYDRQELNHVYERGVSGQSNSWRNPDTGNVYQVTPQPVYPNTTEETPCRQAEILATIDGKTEKTYTTACRNSSGQWVLKN
jgi:surface antigen